MWNLGDDKWSPNSSPKPPKKRRLKKRNAHSLFSTLTPPSKKLKVEAAEAVSNGHSLAKQTQEGDHWEVKRDSRRFTSTGPAFRLFCSRNPAKPYNTVRLSCETAKTCFQLWTQESLRRAQLAALAGCKSSKLASSMKTKTFCCYVKGEAFCKQGI